MNSVELRQQRAELIAQTKEWFGKIEAEGRDITGDDDVEWQKRQSEIDRLEQEARKAERKERLEHYEADAKEPVARKTSPVAPGTRFTKEPSKAERNKVLKAWLGHGAGLRMNVDGDTMNRAAEMGMPLHQATMNTRSMNVGTNSAGGYGTFTTTFPELQTELKYYSRILDKVKLQTTSDGNTFTFPRGTDVANTMAIVSEGSGSGTSTDPTFDRVQLKSYQFRYIELVTYEMLEDAVFDVEGWLTSRLAERAGRTLEKYIVSGAGTTEPTGLIAAAVAADSGTPAVTLASTHKNLYQFEDLMDLFAAVDPAYRQNCTLVVHDKSVWDLRKITDDVGRFIWDVNNTLLQNAQPDKLAGFNYLVSNSMDAPGSFSKNIGVFADLSRYVVRMVDGVRITRLNELYRANGCIGFEVVMRFDSNYIGHAASIARIKTATS